MSQFLQDIALQSMDDVLVAKNDGGHLTEPILFLDREPIPADAQDFDNVLVFIEGEIRKGGKVERIAVTLDEDNDYRQPIPIPEGVEGVDWYTIGLDTTRLTIDGTDIVKNSSFSTLGTYNNVFVIIVADAPGTTVIDVTLVVTRRLEVRQWTAAGTGGSQVSGTDPAYHGESTSLTTEDDNRFLRVYRVPLLTSSDLKNVDPSKITAELSGLQSDYRVITISKVSSLEVTVPISTTFRIESLNQYVDVTVNLIPVVPMTLEFVDPLSSEAGVAGTGAVYIYV